MTSKSTNPFNKDENLQPFFEADLRYVASKEHSLQTFMTQQTNAAQTAATTKTKSFSFLNFLKSHALVSLLALILIFGSIGVAAAEILAPDNIKPSSFFATKDSSSVQELPEVLSVTADDFTFEYDRSMNVLSINGTIQASASCYEVLTSSLIPSTQNSQTIYTYILTVGIPKNDENLDEILASCKEETTAMTLEQTFDVVLEQNEQIRFAELFDVQIEQEEFDVSKIPSKPFITDDAYGVYLVNDCDIAIRHSKNILSESKTVPAIGARYDGIFNEHFIGADDPQVFSNRGVGIGCVGEQSVESLVDQYIKFSGVEYTRQQLTQSELCQTFNFTPQSCKLISEDTITSLTVTTAGTPVFSVNVFDVNDKTYILRDIFGSANQQKMSFTIQFNSLAPSTASTPIADNTPPTDESPATPNLPTREQNGLGLIPSDHFGIPDLCGDEGSSSVKMSWKSQLSMFRRSNSSLMSQYDFAQRIDGVIISPQSSDMFTDSVEISCFKKNQTSNTSDALLANMVNSNRFVSDTTKIKPATPEMVNLYLTTESRNKITNAKYIENRVSAFNPTRITVLEYGDYLILIEKAITDKFEPGARLTEGQVLLYLK